MPKNLALPSNVDTWRRPRERYSPATTNDSRVKPACVPLPLPAICHPHPPPSCFSDARQPARWSRPLDSLGIARRRQLATGSRLRFVIYIASVRTAVPVILSLTRLAFTEPFSPYVYSPLLRRPLLPHLRVSGRSQARPLWYIMTGRSRATLRLAHVTCSDNRRTCRVEAGPPSRRW